MIPSSPTLARTQALRIVFIGWGAINTRVAELLALRSSAVQIVGIAKRHAPDPESAFPSGVPFIGDPAQLASLQPDLVVEAAGRAAVEPWIPAALAASPAVIIASTSALCDDSLMRRLTDIAESHNSQILIPPGAIGGIDALSGASVVQLDDVLHQIVKPPIAWKSTPAESLINLDALETRTVFFSGTAREAATRYPQNANSTVVTALAGIGLDKTRVELVADPDVRTNGHRIVASGQFGRMEVVLQNNALASNPKTSELTALSLVRLIEHRIARLVI